MKEIACACCGEGVTAALYQKDQKFYARFSLGKGLTSPFYEASAPASIAGARVQLENVCQLLRGLKRYWSGKTPDLPSELAALEAEIPSFDLYLEHVTQTGGTRA